MFRISMRGYEIIIIGAIALVLGVPNPMRGYETERQSTQAGVSHSSESA